MSGSCARKAPHSESCGPGLASRESQSHTSSHGPCHIFPFARCFELGQSRSSSSLHLFCAMSNLAFPSPRPLQSGGSIWNLCFQGNFFSLNWEISSKDLAISFPAYISLLTLDP